jgi:glycine C-acetyltransferase
VAGLSAALAVSMRDGNLRARLWENADYFRTGVRSLGIGTGHSSTFVVPLIVGSNRALLYELGNTLRDRGLFLAPVDFPSVPHDQVRFRASITAAHTRADLDEALNILSDVMAPRVRSLGLADEAAADAVPDVGGAGRPSGRCQGSGDGRQSSEGTKAAGRPDPAVTAEH